MVTLDDAVKQEIDSVEAKDLIPFGYPNQYHHDILNYGISGIVHMFVMRRARAVAEGIKDVKEFLEELGITFKICDWDRQLPRIPLERLEQEGIFIPKMAHIPGSYLSYVYLKMRAESGRPLLPYSKNDYLKGGDFRSGNYVQRDKKIRRTVPLFDCDLNNVMAFLHFNDPKFLKDLQAPKNHLYDESHLTEEGLREREKLLSLIFTYNRETKGIHYKGYLEDDFKNPEIVETGILFGQRMWEAEVRKMNEYFQRCSNQNPTTKTQKPDLLSIAKTVIDYYDQLIVEGV